MRDIFRSDYREFNKTKIDLFKQTPFCKSNEPKIFLVDYTLIYIQNKRRICNFTSLLNLVFVINLSPFSYILALFKYIIVD